MIRERQFEVIKTQQVNQHLLCSICREVFYNPIRATCGHTFCGTCLVRWIQMKKSCPLCRHKLERNYQFDKDILATKIVGDIEVKCLRCQSWEGTLAQFKQHKKSQCTYISTNNEIHQDAIEIGDDEEEFTFAGLTEENEPRQQIIENIGQQILAQIDQSQNPESQQPLQQNQNLTTIQQDSPQETNANKDPISDQVENPNNSEELNIELSQKNPDNIDSNNNKSQNDENQINNTFVQDDSNNQNNSNQQVEQKISQVSEVINQQQEQPQIPDSNPKDIQIANQINNQPDVIEQQGNVQQENAQQENAQLAVVENEQNQIQNESKEDQSNQNNETNQSIVEQFKINDPDVEIINPTIKYQNNKELKQVKANKKFKINILRNNNNVKIAEPMMEEINDNLFYEFVDQMKKEMVKKLSDIQYYNTLLG
ncbi:unnamed protein product (macronuclear) [Paramecium tetraurelia]|uniref:RING-type domain-containing protein n=1 Tax=Paramecium tetraurelia TaxID=5888 RepID=A0C1A9_PARTE|nr:uncharacterized protein GSPATT00034052001 [Paramecium tetraurelia]CAK64576.1 unnamed protein product [Paramecium tetraurelia]|eukprot:XP_001431974.1 hypothetical protein (macronuclear) [Paramecium tetraurelia strain d4-2]